MLRPRWRCGRSCSTRSTRTRSRRRSSRRPPGILGGLWEKVRERPAEFLDPRIIEAEGLDVGGPGLPGRHDRPLRRRRSTSGCSSPSPGSGRWPGTSYNCQPSFAIIPTGSALRADFPRRVASVRCNSISPGTASRSATFRGRSSRRKWRRRGCLSDCGAGRAGVRHPQGQGSVPAGRDGADRAGAAVQPVPRAVPHAGDTRLRPAVSPASEMSGGRASGEVEEEDLETSYYRDDQIDLNELLREQFYLALPMKPLCREDCNGLCPQCGTNLNTGHVRLQRRWRIPRLAPLKTAGRRRVERERRHHAESKTPTFEDPHRQAPHARRAHGAGDGPVPAVPRAEGCRTASARTAATTAAPGRQVDESPVVESNEPDTRPHAQLRMIRIAVDAMGGDHAPAVDRRWRGGRGAAPGCRVAARRRGRRRRARARARIRTRPVAARRSRRRCARRRSGWRRRRRRRCGASRGRRSASPRTRGPRRGGGARSAPGIPARR